MRVFIGYDPREHEAALVCAETLREVTDGALSAELLDTTWLRQRGLLTRLRDERGTRDYDLVSNHTYSTRFNISRFLVPILCQNGPALFVDCDMVFVRDPRQMLIESATDVFWDSFAVCVVKHDHAPTRSVKMMDQAQNVYQRKNWSSVMLFNCDDVSNRRLTLWDVNNRHRDELHSFYWLHDHEIGALSESWNWLVNEQPKPPHLGIAHFTNGGPFNADWSGAEHDDLWLDAAQRTGVRS
jgi:hypothetical protein